MYKLEQTFEEQISLKSLPEKNFDCNVCKDIAQEPVVSSCGHLFCWNCIYDKKQCFVCQNKFSKQQFIPIYTSHQGQDKRKCIRPIPPKPKAKLREKIKNFNTTANNDIPLTMALHNNFQRQIPLAGNGYFPPIIINALGNFDQSEQHGEPSQETIKSSIGKFSILLLVIVCILILIS